MPKSTNGMLVLMLITIIIFVIIVVNIMPDTVMTGEEAVQQDLTVDIAAGPESGMYYSLAEKLAQMFVDNGIDAKAIATSGSLENISKLQAGSAEMAIVMQDALAGEEAAAAAQVLTVLYPNYIQVAVRADSGIDSLSELAGKKVAVGAAGSGVEAGALAVLGDIADQAELLNETDDAALSHLADGSIDAAFVTSGLPNAAVTALAETTPLALLPVTAEDNTLTESGWQVGTIPVGTYGIAADVPTLYIDNVLVATAAYPERAVGAIQSLLDKNLEGILAEIR